MAWGESQSSHSSRLRKLWQSSSVEIQTLVRLAVPVSTSFLLNKAVSFVSVVFVGHLGPADLAAASLGSSLTNVVGNSVLAGLAGAMSTLCGQVHLQTDCMHFCARSPILHIVLHVQVQIQLCVPDSTLYFKGKYDQGHTQQQSSFLHSFNIVLNAAYNVPSAAVHITHQSVCCIGIWSQKL